MRLGIGKESKKNDCPESGFNSFAEVTRIGYRNRSWKPFQFSIG